MSLKILFIKRKRENSFHSSLPHIRPAGPSLFFSSRGPAPQPAAQLASPFSRSPQLAPAAQPRRPSRASPAARTVPAQPRRTRQLPGPAADARVPPVGAVPYPARLGNRPLLALQQPPPRRALWARPPVALGLVKRQPSPPSRAPCCPRSVFASSRPQLPHGGAPPTTDLAVRVAVVSEPSPPPIFAGGELAVVPSPSPCVSFRVSWLLAPFPQASASSMPPAMAPAPGLPLRPSSRRGREPLYPPISRVSSVAILVDRRLLTARASELHAAGHGLPRRSHCSGRPKPPRLIRTVHRAINGRK